ncbi:MAG: Rne/Rng family ribonuclease [Terriglobales bacterium]
MTKELFVSTTPHETKVGMVEDDLLAEVYLERENEYTLAGSIYKGRVTRVLPGMQSAFVDIGLERDAFLYVSDFMELEDSEDMDDVPTGRPTNGASHEKPAHERPERNAQERRPRPQAVAASNETEAAAGVSLDSPELPAGLESEAREGHNGESREREDRGGLRGRRRRRGRRGERPERSTRPASDEPRESTRPEFQARTNRPERGDFGPPPGYQPIILPGESISKYSRMAGAASAPARSRYEEPAASQENNNIPLGEKFPDDEPLFALKTGEGTDAAAIRKAEEKRVREIESDDWDREMKRQHERNVAAVFGTSETLQEEAPAPATARAIVEEEIEEEEADLAHYSEEIDDDAEFAEMEEEVHAAGELPEERDLEITAEAGTLTVEGVESLEDGDETVNSFSAGTSMAFEEGDQLATEQGVEQEEEEAEDAEIDEAQAEAEAILAAEAGGNLEARVETRGTSSQAGYTQRAPRQGFDRGRGSPRGRRGGRRFVRREQQNVPLISDLLKEGQEILVQIAKEPIGKKGARITSHIALPGRFLVYMPTVNHGGVSRKISSEEERQRLKRIIQSERENGHGGFIVRTAAQGADEEELRADIRFLKGLWNEIKTRTENGKGPTLIYHDLNVVERILRDQVTSDFSAVWVDTEQEYERVLRFANRFQPALVKKIKFYSKETPLFEQFGLSDEINKALKSKVWLKSGGYIVINQTEALVAIDINTGKYVGKTARLEDTIVKTNVDAIKEIVRQIRLRDLGGIIIIDFIDMDERRNRQRVMQALEEALRADRAPSKVLQFNDFGLVAITRKRVKQSLERTIGTPCPYCESTGYVKSVPTICNDVYIEMRKMAKHLEHVDVMLRVNPEVAKALKANNGKLLLEMEELTKKTVIVKSDPALHQEQFDIN